MIRSATADDCASICSIYNHYITNSHATFEEVALSASQVQQRQDKIDALGLPWLVAQEQGEVLGYAYANQWNPRGAYRHCVEVSIYLSSAASSQGLGSMLYAALLEELPQRDITQAIAIIALPNNTSIALHEKFGFRQVAVLPRVGFKFERWIDVGYWQLGLRPTE